MFRSASIFAAQEETASTVTSCTGEVKGKGKEVRRRYEEDEGRGGSQGGCDFKDLRKGGEKGAEDNRECFWESGGMGTEWQQDM